MSGLPSRDELNEAVDAEFHGRHPEAPPHLDPDQPAHAELVAEWIAIRDHKVNEWTDDVFASFFPDAGKLDAGNPRDQTLIEYWLDIRDQMRDGGPGRYDWTGFTPTTAAEYRRSDQQGDDFDPVTPDVRDAMAAIHGARDTLAAVFEGTDIAARVSRHLDSQMTELIRVNGEGVLAGGGVWQSEALSASAPDPDSPDDPYFVQDLAIHARLDDLTFTVEAGVFGKGRGPNGTLGL